MRKVARPRALAGTAGLLTVLTGLAACAAAGEPGAASSGSSGGSPAAEAVAVATTTPLGSVVDDIARCAGGTSTTLMSPGDDPHTFAPSAAQVSALVRSPLVIANGLGLEEGLSTVLTSAQQDGATVFEVAPLLDPIPFGGAGGDPHGEPGDHDDHDDHGEPGGHDDDHDHPATPGSTGPGATPHTHAHGSQDPHVWLDVSRMAKAAGLIGDRLATQTGKEAYRTCGAQTRAALLRTHEAVTATLAAVPPARRILVTDHDAFGYFARAYDFRVAAVVVPGGSTDAEPSSAELTAVTKVVTDTKVPAIFSNVAARSVLADAVAKEAGRPVAVVPLYVGSVGPKGSGAATYAEMMTTNATRIADALTG